MLFQPLSVRASPRPKLGDDVWNIACAALYTPLSSTTIVDRSTSLFNTTLSNIAPVQHPPRSHHQRCSAPLGIPFPALCLEASSSCVVVAQCECQFNQLHFISKLDAASPVERSLCGVCAAGCIAIRTLAIGRSIYILDNTFVSTVFVFSVSILWP